MTQNLWCVVKLKIRIFKYSFAQMKNETTDNSGSQRFLGIFSSAFNNFVNLEERKRHYQNNNTHSNSVYAIIF